MIIDDIFFPQDRRRPTADLASERLLWIEHVANPLELSPIARWEPDDASSPCTANTAERRRQGRAAHH